MTINLALKAALIWLSIACLAVLNGILRENVFTPLLGVSIALPLSGLLLSVIVFLVTWFLFNFIRNENKASYILIGLQWVLMTLAFEVLFGHFIVGKPWQIILQVFDITSGDLFVVVLIVSLLSPYLVARLKGAI